MDLGKVGVVIAARLDSRRLPAKALLPLGGTPMLLFLARRLRPSLLAHAVILATTDRPSDDPLAALAAGEGIPVFRGSPHDLIDRYAATASAFDLDTLVRVTGDCPFVDAESLDYCLRLCLDAADFDVATTKGRFPVGLDYEIIPMRTIEVLRSQPDLRPDHREHLTLYLYDHSRRFVILPLEPKAEWRSNNVWTVDVPDDYARAAAAADALGGDAARLEELAAWLPPAPPSERPA